ncbi:uncharacterized protein C11orf97 homolog isoform X1 [Empidonax traillii]|uniref:uncharacterized protein C11orf97 homolog isoform X1 n=1 Tax=Empidonax traillii TaxID=164674 RepID=UPI000FFD354C|nr:uncharacterized protein C11orf97 homolog isoform X1 [Empidonax traillii]
MLSHLGELKKYSRNTFVFRKKNAMLNIQLQELNTTISLHPSVNELVVCSILVGLYNWMLPYMFSRFLKSLPVKLALEGVWDVKNNFSIRSLKAVSQNRSSLLLQPQFYSRHARMKNC